MPVIYLGQPTASGANVKVLESSEYQKEQNGLETLVENYIIRSANRIALQPSRNTVHSTFSTADIKYTRMVVEEVAFREQRGGITGMTVTYVGLTSASGLPFPVLRTLPVTNKIYIEAEYVTNENEETLINIGNIARMPAQINGYTMPNNPPVTNLFSNALTGDRLTDLGYCHDQAQCNRRGLFLVVRRTFRRKYFGLGIYAGATDI